MFAEPEIATFRYAIWNRRGGFVSFGWDATDADSATSEVCVCIQSRTNSAHHLDMACGSSSGSATRTERYRKSDRCSYVWDSTRTSTGYELATSGAARAVLRADSAQRAGMVSINVPAIWTRMALGLVQLCNWVASLGRLGASALEMDALERVGRQLSTLVLFSAPCPRIHASGHA